MMNEQWKPIIGYENEYSVSNTGIIRGLKRSKNRKPYINEWGYEVVCLSKSGTKSKTVFIHRLVAQAFISNPDNKPQVNHKNGIKTDNNVSNLEWCTGEENQQHAFSLGLNKANRGEEHNRSILTSESVVLACYLRSNAYTYSEIMKILLLVFNIEVSRTTINAALLGQSWSHLKEIKDGKFRKCKNREPRAGY